MALFAARSKMRRWPTAAVSCLAAVMLALALVEYRSSRDIDAALADQSVILADLQQQVASARMSKLAEEAGERPEFYIAGDTVPIAGATLQNILTQIVEERGGALSQVEFIPTVENTARRATLKLSFFAKLENVQNILFDIESRQPLMLISSLSLQAESTGRSLEHSGDMLRAVMAVDGYLRPEGG
ncbi:type II secretion system protein GspM [Aurantimonas sp. NFXS3]|uniref:type II secretion system protein GspM n=1 Tax=Aurantimonas sp. NFXS3 TaxID=2818434 RepID=UPI003B8CFA37